MDVHRSDVCLDGVCIACLSTGRRLETLAGAAQQYFQEIIKETVGERRDAVVCWECASGVRAALRLRRRVARAAVLQQKYLHTMEPQIQNSKHLQSLSQLSCCTNTSMLLMTYKDQITTQNKGSVDLCIKQENNDDETDEVEGGFCAENTAEAACNTVDDNAFKAVLTTDMFNYEIKVDHFTSDEKKSGKTDTDEFDESDEEPLTLKKLKQESTKERGMRKEQDGAEVGTTRRGRGRGKGARGEQAAGVVRSARVTSRLQRLGLPPDALEMVVLSWEEVERERQRALSREQYMRHEHRCSLCAVGFNQRSKLAEHMLKHDPARGSLECSACHIRVREPHALAAHRRRHRVRWRCVECGALWSRAAVAADHAARAHRAAAPTHACPVCPHTAPTLGKLRTHLKEHGVRARCHECGKSLRDRASLRTHLQIHLGVKEHECPAPGCGKRFVFKKAMQLHHATHLQHHHLYCHQCDMTFKNHTTFYHHMKYSLQHVHPDSLKHVCSVCGRRFLGATRLAEHRAAVHLKTTPHRCTQPGCNYASASRPGLRAHVRSVHRGQRPRRDHVCHTCGKQFTTKRTLEGHLRSHSGERPFRCAQCGAAFGYHAALYNHTRRLHGQPKAKKSLASPAAGIEAPPAPPQGGADPARGEGDGAPWTLPAR